MKSDFIYKRFLKIKLSDQTGNPCQQIYEDYRLLAINQLSDEKSFSLIFSEKRWEKMSFWKVVAPKGNWDEASSKGIPILNLLFHM